MSPEVSTKKYASRLASGGAVKSKRFHLFEDCHVIEHNGHGGVVELTDREVELLGMSICTHCHKRQTGGPGLEILEGFFGEDFPGDGEPPEMAWRLHEYLKNHGAYVAVRKK